MIRKEIGSEFYKENLENATNNNLNFIKIGKDFKLLMSGRTAIDYILKNISDTKKIAYLPSYSCESIALPFIENNYVVKYYDVFINDNKLIANINEAEECSIFFLMNYFGYSEFNIEKYAKEFKNKNVIIIEDITHSFLSKKRYSKFSDYLICSLRKWFPIYTGGIAINMHNFFKISVDNYTVNNEQIKMRKEAMELKAQYLKTGNKKYKNKFLNLYKESNLHYAFYQNKSIDDESIEILKKMDIKKIKRNRINNSKIIEKYLLNNSEVKLLFHYTKGDCPLFVPVLAKNRNELQKKLINESIFCPIHWPNYLKSTNTIYDEELSLICDHRYSKKEIERYIKLLIKLAGE